LAAVQPVKDVYDTLNTSLTMDEIESLKKAVNSVRSELIK